MTNLYESATETKHKLPGLDHLRALAILFVFLFHYGRIFPHPQWTNTTSKFGWTGVDLFFVLSGYLISSQLFAKMAKGKTISLKEFFLKRFFRIIPAYLVVVLIYFSFPFVREHEALSPLWKYLTFTLNFGLDLRTQGTFSHAWSLCIEEQFYLLFPLILVTLIYFRSLKKGAWLIVSLFIAGFAVRIYSYYTFITPFLGEDYAWSFWNEWIYYPTYCRLDGLLAGVSIAALFQFRPLLKDRIIKSGNLVFVLSMLILASAYFLCLNEQSFKASVFGFPLVSIGYGLMVIAAISPTCFLCKFRSNITTAIATLSYSLYLAHKFVTHVTQEQLSKFNIEKNSNLMFLICIITTLAFSFLMNRIIEKPFLRLRNALIK
jgi:peptidoglycan/LPS O-acetylase OafA/YrhL